MSKYAINFSLLPLRSNVSSLSEKDLLVEVDFWEEN